MTMEREAVQAWSCGIPLPGAILAPITRAGRMGFVVLTSRSTPRSAWLDRLVLYL